MAFVVEDGTGIQNANSYISVAYADQYFADRDVISWVGSLVAKQGAIVQATDYIEKRWGTLFHGSRAFPSLPQALSFPRVGLYDRDGYLVLGIPENLKKATAEYALRAYNKDLMPDPQVIDSAIIVSKTTEKVGPIEDTKEYQAVTIQPTTIRPYPAADRWLAQYVSASGRNYRC